MQSQTLYDKTKQKSEKGVFGVTEDCGKMLVVQICIWTTSQKAPPQTLFHKKIAPRVTAKRFKNNKMNMFDGDTNKIGWAFEQRAKKHGQKRCYTKIRSRNSLHASLNYKKKWKNVVRRRCYTKISFAA